MPSSKHRELRRVDLDGHRGRVHVRQLELAALESFVDEDEAAHVPGEDLHAVAAARDEDKEVSRVGVFRELLLHDGHQAIDRLPHIDRRRTDENADRPRDGDHGLQRRGERAQVSEIGSRRESEPGARRQRQLQETVARRCLVRPPPRLRRGRYHANRYQTRALPGGDLLGDLIGALDRFRHQRTRLFAQSVDPVAQVAERQPPLLSELPLAQIRGLEVRHQLRPPRPVVISHRALLGENAKDRRPRSAPPDVRHRAVTIHRLVVALHRVYGDRAKVLAWLNTANPELGRSRPMDLVLDGRAESAADLVDATMAGVPT